MKTASATFELLSKLLSEKNTPQTEHQKYLEQMYRIVTEDLSHLLERSSYPQKSKLMADLKENLERLEILSQFPELIGKATVGIHGTKGKLDRVLLDFISNGRAGNIYQYNNNIPAIIYKSEKVNQVRAVNLIESIFPLSESDFKDTNKELFRQDLDIRQFLHAFSITADIPHDWLTYIHFPFYSLKSKEYYDLLMDLVDVFMIPVDERGNWKRMYESFRKQHKHNIVLVAADEMLDEVEQFADAEKAKSFGYKQMNLQVCRLGDELYDCLDSFNKGYDNLAAAETFLAILSDFFLYQSHAIKEQTGFVEGMNQDIVNIEDEDTQDRMREIREKLSATMKKEKEIYSSFQVVVEDLMKSINDFEESLFKVPSLKTAEIKESNLNYRPDFEENMLKFILNMIESEELATANSYIEKLNMMGYQYTYIFESFKRSVAGKKPLKKDLDKLSNTKKDNLLVLKAKVRFGEDLGLKLEEMAEMAKQLPVPRTAHENYVIGADYQSQGRNDQAKYYFNLALEAGYLKAGDTLIEFVDSSNLPELEKLANMLIPEANYLYGIRCLESNRYARGITCLKIAAVYKHLGAIRKLADIEFNNVVKTKQRFDDRTEKSLNIARDLYRFLLSEQVKDDQILENLGKLYYWTEDYRSAISLFEQCNTAEAKYLCGRIFQYGNGVARDLPKAQELLKKASDMGHRRAAVEYEKVCGWIASNSSREKYNSSKSYASTSSSSYTGSSSGFCFLTTATCHALGKEDNCEEILAFKKYRDQQLINDDDGSVLIREYYRIAPEILQRISEQGNDQDIFHQLYNRFISVGYGFLLEENYQKAKATYMDMVEYLCDTYGVDTIFK